MTPPLQSLGRIRRAPLDQEVIDRALAPVPTAVVGIGDPRARLLAGPGEDLGAEPLHEHLLRLGPLPDDPDGGLARLSMRESGLRGRGGGGFPTARKLRTALQSGGSPVVVVNASESEPASRKDDTLCRLRPHLVLDGAAVAAAAAGSEQVVVHLHRGAGAARRALERALSERAAAGVADPTWYVSSGPNRYVAGEASAIASFIEGGEAKPRFSGRPLAEAGVHGRPTIVNNVETVAHLALLARFGASWWRGVGGEDSPGSRLVTVTGGIGQPGLVLETVDTATVGDILTAAGVGLPPAAVLIGGYAGTWLDANAAWSVAFDPVVLRANGASVGCGLVAVLPHGHCGLAETARLSVYLAQESAGQCGPCLFGLAELAEIMTELASGDARPRHLRALRRCAAAVEGRGACRHPDGVVSLLDSALDTFDDDVARHLAGRPCRGAGRPPLLPIPLTDTSWR